jgi:hypothetical protein
VSEFFSDISQKFACENDISYLKNVAREPFDGDFETLSQEICSLIDSILMDENFDFDETIFEDIPEDEDQTGENVKQTNLTKEDNWDHLKIRHCYVVLERLDASKIVRNVASDRKKRKRDKDPEWKPANMKKFRTVPDVVVRRKSPRTSRNPQF